VKVEALIRAHRELGLLMGYADTTRGTNHYTYAMLQKDMNTVHPQIVRSLDQMKRAMLGQIEVPPYWAKVLDELLQLGVSGYRYPPTPGPFWHPQPLDLEKRRRAAVRLVEWQAFHYIYNKDLADAAQITRTRISQIRHGRSAILPTELDRIAAAFNTDVQGFLEGPLKRQEGA
jgi:hypothetical protein